MVRGGVTWMPPSPLTRNTPCKVSFCVGAGHMKSVELQCHFISLIIQFLAGELLWPPAASRDECSLRLELLSNSASCVAGRGV
jgi:hypothetical protein